MNFQAVAAAVALCLLTNCDPARVKEVHVSIPPGRTHAMRFVEDVDRIAHSYGFQSHPAAAPQFPRHVGFWNRKARAVDEFTTLGCDIEYLETENVLKIRIVRFPGTSLTPAGEGLYREVMALIEKRGYCARIVFDD